MARDGQGLEVSNADTEAIASLDFLRDEWLGFGNRLDEFLAAADKEATCAMLPVMAANLLLSMHSSDGRDRARRYLARAKQLGPEANAREKATALSEALKLKLIRVLTVSEDSHVARPVPKMARSMMALEAGGPETPVFSGEIKVDATVTLVFEIGPE